MTTPTTPLDSAASAGAIRLPLGFDPLGLVRDLDALVEGAWLPHFNTGLYDGGWSGLALRAPADAGHPVEALHAAPGASQFVDLPAFAHCPHFRAVVSALRCEVNAVRLLRLAPGARIAEHCDHELGRAFGEARLHVPVRTHPAVDFRVAGERVSMCPGEVWYIDASQRHAVHNGSDVARVHLVVDCLLNDWLDAQLSAGDAIGTGDPAPVADRVVDEAVEEWPLTSRFDEPITARILAFLRSLGLTVEIRALPGKTFLPGIALDRGTLWVDPHRLAHPGDLLHEAGHLAVLTSDERCAAGPEVSSDPAQEMMAIAWSWAALTHLQLDPAEVFHAEGYKGDAQWLSETYAAGTYIGLPMLQWIGLTADREHAPALGVEPFPHMLRWLRD